MGAATANETSNVRLGNVMMISPDDVKAATYINYNVDDRTLGASIRETQEIHLRTIIGSNLYRRLQELIKAQVDEEEDNIDSEGNELYKELLDDYIHPYLEAKVQAVICLPISLKIRNYGVAKNSDTNIQAPTLKEIMALQKRYNTISAKYATLLSHYLCAHKEDFIELTQTTCNCGDFIPAQLGKTYVECGLVLGDTKNGCKC